MVFRECLTAYKRFKQRTSFCKMNILNIAIHVKCDWYMSSATQCVKCPFALSLAIQSLKFGPKEKVVCLRIGFLRV